MDRFRRKLLSIWAKIPRDVQSLRKMNLSGWIPVVISLTGVCLVGFVMATIVTSYIGKSLASKVIASLSMTPRSAVSDKGTLPRSNLNYLKLQRSIEDRNLFNSNGEFPDESSDSGIGEGEGGARVSVFDLKAPCKKPSLDVSLIGVIYLGPGHPHSLATVQEKGFTQADTYRIGDEIIGFDDVSVAAIENQMLVLNNKGVKECLEIAPPKAIASSAKDSGFGDDTKNSPSESLANATVGGEVTLEAIFVEQQIGQGGGNILNQGRLVPFNQDGVMKGFKLISLKQGGLFDKIGLKNGDVIMQVNDTSLKQPDQGFAFYQAFENETAIRIDFERGGQPSSRSVKIR